MTSCCYDETERHWCFQNTFCLKTKCHLLLVFVLPKHSFLQTAFKTTSSFKIFFENLNEDTCHSKKVAMIDLV